MHTHTRAGPGRGVLRLKGAVSASTRNSPGALAESPVERRTVRETGRVSDRVHTHQTTAAHAAQDRSRRDLPGTTPSRGPEGVRLGARSAPLPRQGPAVGTKSPVLGRPPRAPPQQASKARGDSPRGGGRHNGDGTADRSTESDPTGRGAAHQRGATRHAGEARRRRQPRHEDRCQATTATGCREPGKRAQHTTNRGTGQAAKDSPALKPEHRTRGQWEAGPGRRPERTGGRAWESARPRTPHTQVRGATPGRPRAAPTARKASSQERAL